MNTKNVIQHSHAVLNKHARTFSLASRLLPGEVRDNVAVTYAVCRLIDDTVDDAPSPAEAKVALQHIQNEWNGQSSPRPLLRLFRDICDEHDIPEGAVSELMLGVGGDLGTIRFESDRELLRYSYRVAGTVGIIMARLIGVTDANAIPHAIDLGVGMQITNICRDVLEDAKRNRVYIPESRLKAQKVSQDDLLDGSVSKAALGRVISDLLLLADQYYESGRQGMPYIPAIPRTAISTAAQMYQAIGSEIERRHYNVMAGRTIVGPASKLKWFTVGVGYSLLSPLQNSGDHKARLHRYFDGLAGANSADSSFC